MGQFLLLVILTTTLPINLLHILLPYHLRSSKRFPTKIFFPFLISFDLTTFQIILDVTIIAVPYADPGGRAV